jgi:hypothetical protein
LAGSLRGHRPTPAVAAAPIHPVKLPDAQQSIQPTANDACRDKFGTAGFMPKGLCRTSAGDRPIGIGDAEQPTEIQKTKFEFRSWNWIWGQAPMEAASKQ